jgi:pyridoxamine 5'-phosphate oxidase family protein
MYGASRHQPDSQQALEKTMSIFTEQEQAYLTEQPLGRLATADTDGQPHVVPVGFRYNPDTDTIDIGGYGLARSKKFRNASVRPEVAFVVDDLVSTDPWTPRMVTIRGTAEVFTEGGRAALASVAPGFDEAWIRIWPRRIIAMGEGLGQDGDPYKPNSRSIG